MDLYLLALGVKTLVMILYILIRICGSLSLQMWELLPFVSDSAFSMILKIWRLLPKKFIISINKINSANTNCQRKRTSMFFCEVFSYRRFGHDFRQNRRALNAWTHYIQELLPPQQLQSFNYQSGTFFLMLVILEVLLSLEQLILCVFRKLSYLRPGAKKDFPCFRSHWNLFFNCSSILPYIFMVLTGPKKWIIFGIQWGITLLGIFF